MTQPDVLTRKCYRCKDLGYYGARSEEAKDVFETGIVCDCEAGKRYYECREEWLRLSTPIRQEKAGAK